MFSTQAFGGFLPLSPWSSGVVSTFGGGNGATWRLFISPVGSWIRCIMGNLFLASEYFQFVNNLNYIDILLSKVIHVPAIPVPSRRGSQIAIIANLSTSSLGSNRRSLLSTWS